MKIYPVSDLGTILAIQAGYRHPVEGSALHHLRKQMGDVPIMGAMKRFANVSAYAGIAAGVDAYSYGTTQLHPLGTIAFSKDGRIFRYATAGAAALVAGNIVQSAAPIANHLALTSAAQAIGDGSYLLSMSSNPIVVTPGATAGAANLYAEGTLVVSTAPGNGTIYRIAGHAAITASTAFNLFLDPDDTIQVALTTSSKYGLHHNPWKNVIQCPTTITARVVGGVLAVIPANTTAANYGWVQTRGPFPALINGTPAITAPIVNSATTAGAVDVWTAAAQPTANFVGHMMQLGVSGENDAVFLEID